MATPGIRDPHRMRYLIGSGMSLVLSGARDAMLVQTPSTQLDNLQRDPRTQQRARAHTGRRRLAYYRQYALDPRRSQGIC